MGSYQSDRATDVINTSDGGYAVLVESMDFDEIMMMSAGAGIVKLNAAGDTLWSSAFMLSANTLIPVSIEETSDNGFVIGAHSGGQLIMIKTDVNGAMEWNKTYQPTAAQCGGAFQTPDGGYMIAGSSYGFGNYSDFLVVKTDALGDTTWTKSYDTGESDLLYSANPTADGGCILGGRRVWLSTPAEDEFLYMKIDANGNLEFSKEFDSNWSNFNHICYSIKQTSDLNYIAVGSGDNYASMYFWPWVAKLDANGDKIWAHDYRDQVGSISSQDFRDVTELANGDFVATGRMADTPSDKGLSLVRFASSNGSPAWRREYKPGGNEYGLGITATPDGGVLAVGNSTLSGAYSGAYLVKADSLGFAAGCFANSTTIYSSSNGSASAISTTVGSGVVIVGTQTLTLNSGLEMHKLIPEVSVVSTDPLCDEDCNGEGEVSATGGQGSYSWLWSTGGNLSTEIGLCPAWYYVDVTDAGGCVVQDSMEIIAPSSVVVTGVVSHVTCNGDFDGAIDITVSGGAGNYEFDWPTGATSEDLSGLGGGFYLVNVEDSNGCDEQFGAIIQEPQVLASYITSTTDASCKDMCDGEIATLTIGGTAPYTLLWNDPLAQAVDTAIGLCDGTYLLTVTDNNGCIAYLNGNIIEPDELFTSTNSSSTECGLSSGEAWVMPTGGTMPYAYDWNGMGSNDTLSSLDAGWFDVLVTDNNGCTAMDSALIESFVSPIDICVVTVDSIGENVVNWNKPAAGNIDGFKIYRNIAGVYTPVGYRDYDSLSYYVDTDFGVDPAVTSYRYKVSVVDTCGAESDLSGFHETIHLTSNVGTGGEVNLIWDDYEGFSFGFYDILRDSTGTEDWEVIGTVPFTNFTFIDFNVPSSGADYMIEVVTPAFCDATKAIGDFNSSRSNRKSGIANVSGIFDAEALALNMYPNPATNILYVEANMAYASDVNFSILDYTGKLILTENDQNLAGSIRKGIDIESLPVGYYILEFATADGSVRKQFVKM